MMHARTEIHSSSRKDDTPFHCKSSRFHMSDTVQSPRSVTASEFRDKASALEEGKEPKTPATYQQIQSPLRPVQSRQRSLTTHKLQLHEL